MAICIPVNGKYKVPTLFDNYVQYTKFCIYRVPIYWNNRLLGVKDNANSCSLYNSFPITYFRPTKY